MATRAAPQNSNRQAGLRNSDVPVYPRDDGTVFHSMTEFKYWVAIVTLLIICILSLILMIAHQSKQIKKTEVILYRLEEKEKKSKLKTEKEE